MRLGTWNVRSLYKAGSLVTVPRVKKKGKSDPCNRPWRPIGLRGVKDPTLSKPVCPNLGSASKSKGVCGIVYFH
jgi:hypothetical protein